MTKDPLAGWPNLKDALRVAADLGCEMRHRKGTGEIIVSHPLWERTILVNCRRKDTPGQLLKGLRGLAAALPRTKK